MIKKVDKKINILELFRNDLYRQTTPPHRGTISAQEYMFEDTSSSISLIVDEVLEDNINYNKIIYFASQLYRKEDNVVEIKKNLLEFYIENFMDKTNTPITISSIDINPSIKEIMHTIGFYKIPSKEPQIVEFYKR